MPDGPSAPLDSTAVLIRRVREGDRDSLERLVQRHLAPLRRYVSGRLPRWARDLADTDDLVQDTLLRTFSRMDAFEVRGAGALQAYLRQAVMNRLRDELRRKGRVPALVDVNELELAGQGSPLEETIGPKRRRDTWRRWRDSSRRSAKRSSDAWRWSTRTRNSRTCSASRRRTRPARPRGARCCASPRR